jgi:hypothetical protein
MTTFTSDDREEEYKKIVAAAPYQPGYEDAIPIPHNGLASKELTDEEIIGVWNAFERTDNIPFHIDFARALLRKAQEK